MRLLSSTSIWTEDMPHEIVLQANVMKISALDDGNVVFVSKSSGIATFKDNTLVMIK
ncbi:MAG: hypothetical protein ACKVTZ_23255 [Bacteroidia bacterium]